MNQLIQFANIKCDFRSFQQAKLWDMWSYKLSPYQVAEESCDITIEFNYTRECPPKDTLLLVRKSGFFEQRTYKLLDGGYLFDYVRSKNEESCITYYVSPQWNRIVLLKDTTKSAGVVPFEFIGQFFPYCVLKKDMLTFHGVLMEYDGKGIIISAPSGTGKTTHAHLWRDNKNALILNGDRAYCDKTAGRWIGYGFPWSGTSGEQINRSVPIKAIVILERGDKNVVSRINGLEAFGALFPHVQYPSWDSELAGKALELADDFMKEIPVFRLKCLPDVDAVEVLNQAVEEL